MDTIVSLTKRRGFVFGGSEIYGGIGGFWDYGPLGVEMRNNIKRLWWQKMVQEREDIVGVDSAIIMNPAVWQASGHVDTFNDLMVECKDNRHRLRADSLAGGRCPECGSELGEPRPFNTMFKTHVGAVEDNSTLTYLRPETAQGIFVNFANIQQSTRKRMPFGIAQIGKAFRNEVQTGNFIFRDRELEQMEIEFFCRPGTDSEWLEYWKNERLNWWTNAVGIHAENLRARALEPGELAHYSVGTYEIEYRFPMGWSEVEGIANRTDYDLSRHSKLSGVDLQYFDKESQEHYIPYVIEPSMGVERCMLACLLDAYAEERVRNEKRVVLRLHRHIAPVKAAVLPLLRNRPEIVRLARELAQTLKRYMAAEYDDTGSIGRLYRRQDEIGTLWCVTVDVQSLEDQQVTIRDRDSMEQVRVPIGDVKDTLLERLQ